MISRSAFFSDPNGITGDSPPPGYVPNSGYKSGGASEPNLFAYVYFHDNLLVSRRARIAPSHRRPIDRFDAKIRSSVISIVFVLIAP
jgi:hypothetical protein